jgi:D-inositol-3-phosphate glycosyltransferase
MSRAAVKHAAGFSWELTAERTLAAYATARETLIAEVTG